MKRLKYFILVLFILPIAFLFSGCVTVPYVISIEKVSETDNIATFEVTYSDDTTSYFVVENGEDGQDGQDITIDEIFQKCVSLGLYEDTLDGYQQFLSDYLTIEVEDTSETASAVKVMKSAVSVYTVFGTEPYTGAGVIYSMDTSADGYTYIITNYHVTNMGEVIGHIPTGNELRADEIYIYLYGSETYAQYKDDTYSFGASAIECEYVGGARNYDLAILRAKTSDILAVNENACAVTLADGYTLSETVMAIGNPEGVGISLSKGTVSMTYNEIQMEIIEGKDDVTLRVLTTDTAINGGNSGGGLFNMQGELVGIINSSLESTADCIEGMANALPVDNVVKVADNIIEYYESTGSVSEGVRKLYLGINYIAENSKAEYDEQGVTLTDDLVVTYVMSNTTAYGKLRIGDVITGIVIERNGVKTTTMFNMTYELSDMLLTVREGDAVYLKVLRGDSTEEQDILISSSVTSSMLTVIE